MSARLTVKTAAEVLPPLLTVEQVAERLGLHATNVYARIRRGEIPAVRISPRCIRVRADVLDAWERNGGAA